MDQRHQETAEEDSARLGSQATDCNARRSRRIRGWRSPQAWIVLVSVLILGITLDIGTKYWSFATVAGSPVELDREQILARHDPTVGLPGRTVLPWGLLDFRLVLNYGAVFGIGEDRRYFFISFTALALAAGLIIFARFTRAKQTLAHVGIGLVLAGGLGNLYDRIVYGVVRDFLHMLPGWQLPFGLSWPRWFGGSSEVFPWVFNVADMMLLAGMAILLMHINRVEKQRAERSKDSAADSRR